MSLKEFRNKVFLGEVLSGIRSGFIYIELLSLVLRRLQGRASEIDYVSVRFNH